MSPCKRRCRASTSGTSLILEQDGTGDPVAQFLLTGEQAFTYGLDNDDGNKFKMAFSNNGFASGVVAEFTTRFEYHVVWRINPSFHYYGPWYNWKPDH